MAGGKQQDPGPLTQALAEIFHAALQVKKRNKQITQYELAQKVGISDAQISKMLNGHANITFDQAGAICEVLGLPWKQTLADAEVRANVYRLNE